MKRFLALILSAFIAVSFTPSFAFADDADEYDFVPVALDGPAVTLDESSPECSFTAEEDGGYMFTITAPGYLFVIPRFYEVINYDGHIYTNQLNSDIEMIFDDGRYTDAPVSHHYSIYCKAGHEYSMSLEFHVGYVYDNGSAEKNARVSLTKTNKAGLYNGRNYTLEYWCNDTRNYDRVTIMGYTGNAKIVTVPGSINGITVDTVFNDLFSFDEHVEELRFEEGVRVLRNNVASDCPNLRRVSFPSTLEELSNKPFQGCFIDSIDIAANNPLFSWDNEHKSLILAGTNLEGYYGTDEEFRVPDGLLQVDGKALKGSNVKKLYLPDSVKSLSGQQQLIDELHVAASYCDIKYSVYINGDPGTPSFNTIYGPYNSLTEKQAAEYGIPFVADSEAQQYYLIKERQNADDGLVLSYGDSVYRYIPDNDYYGEFTAQMSGDYTLYWESELGYADIDYVKDSSGNDLQLIRCDYDIFYGVRLRLKAGEHYTFKLRHMAGAEFDQLADHMQLWLFSPLAGDPLEKERASSDDYSPAAGKAPNTLSVEGKTSKVKYSKLKKKTQYLPVSKLIRFADEGQGTKKYTLSSAKKKSKSFKKYFKINKSTGKLTIKKGLRKGTYTVKIKVKANGDSVYKASAWKTVTVKVKVK